MLVVVDDDDGDVDYVVDDKIDNNDVDYVVVDDDDLIVAIVLILGAT